MSHIAVVRARADIKDMYIYTIAAERSEGRAKRGDSRGVSRVPSGPEMVPFLEVLDGMVKRGVEVRLIHAKDPGPNCGANAGRGTSPLES